MVQKCAAHGAGDGPTYHSLERPAVGRNPECLMGQVERVEMADQVYLRLGILDRLGRLKRAEPVRAVDQGSTGNRRKKFAQSALLCAGSNGTRADVSKYPRSSPSITRSGVKTPSLRATTCPDRRR